MLNPSNLDLARDPNTLTTTLEKLAEDNDFLIRYEVAQNPNTPVITLMDKIDSSYKWDLFYDLSLNPNTQAEVLIKLSELCIKNNYPAVIRHIMNHPNTPTNLKQYLLARSYVQSSSDT